MLKQRGADAIIFGDSKVVNEGYASISNGSAFNYNGYVYGNATTTSVPMNATVVGAILIKWK